MTDFDRSIISGVLFDDRQARLLSRRDRIPCHHQTPPSPLPSRQASPPQRQQRHQQQHLQRLGQHHHHQMERMRVWWILQRSTIKVLAWFYEQSLQVVRTSLISLPFNSSRSLDRRSSSASIPTEERTSLISDSEGELLPARPRRR